MTTVVLVVPDENPKTKQDFHRIAAAIRSQGISARLVRHKRSEQIALLPLWLSQSMSIAMVRRTDRKLLPGKFFSGVKGSKIDEYRTLSAAGVSVPRWEELRPDTKLDPAEWGPYVVEKPSVGRAGANVRIRKIGRVKFADRASYPPDHLGRRGPMIVQKFVYTGEWPVSYRVITVFGEVVLCIRQTTRRGEPLRARWDFGKGGGTAIVSNTRSMEVVLDANPEMMETARSAHRSAFPDVPLLTFDMAKDIETGEIGIFECHPYFPYWPFSRAIQASIQKANGINYESQFDIMATIGRAIAKKAVETFP